MGMPHKPGVKNPPKQVSGAKPSPPKKPVLRPDLSALSPSTIGNKNVKDVDGYRGKVSAWDIEQGGHVPRPEAGSGYGLAANVTDDMYKVAPELLGDSARAGVTADAHAVGAQNKALDELFGIYSNGGATAQERARMARTRSDQDQYLRSQREAQQQDLAERGMGGSGAEIAMALGDRQNAGTRMAQQDLDTEAMLQDRALGALMQGSNVAGQIRGSSFNEGMARGTAKDEFAAMNNGIINDAKSSNVDFLRQSKANLAQQQFDAWQRGLDRNTGIATGIMGFDQDENQTGWRSGQQTAASDAGAATNAQNNANNAATAGINPGANHGVDTGTSSTVFEASQAEGQGISDAAKGAGKSADGIVNGIAGGESGGAMSFAGSPGDEEDKK
jgi:hypothetical protein